MSKYEKALIIVEDFIENQRLFLSEIDVKGYPRKTNIIDFVAKDTVEMD